MRESNHSDVTDPEGPSAPATAARRRVDFGDLCVLAGVVSITLGAWLLNMSAGLIVFGAAAIVVGVRGAGAPAEPGPPAAGAGA